MIEVKFVQRDCNDVGYHYIGTLPALPLASTSKVQTIVLISQREYVVDHLLLESGNPLVTIKVSPLGELPDASIRDACLKKEGWTQTKTITGSLA